MGWGDFGSNGSVHWQVGYEGNNPKTTADEAGVDNQVKHPNSGGDGRPNIGAAGGHGHSGSFRVTARFASPAAAQAAAATIQVVGSTIRLDVPVRPGTVTGGPGNPNDWEVRVDW